MFYKLQNFLKSCFKFARPNDINAVWEHINKPDENSAEEQQPESNGDTVKSTPPQDKDETLKSKKRKTESGTDEEPKVKKSHKEETEDDGQAQTEQTNGNGRSNGMSLRSTMMHIVREHQKPMKIKKLRKKVYI